MAKGVAKGMRVVLSIAGFDPSGGAGVLADIKTFAALGCYGAAAITSLTSQNTLGVFAAYHQPAEVVRAQIEPLLSDFEIAGVKIGMLPTRETVETVAELIIERSLPNVVLDPVIRSTSGYELIEREAAAQLVERLLPLAALVTPNLAEAEQLTGLSLTNDEGMAKAGERLREMGARAVLVKGGDLKGETEEAIDVLVDERGCRRFSAARVRTRHTHGTGCTLSSAIAARLARGEDLDTAIAGAKEYLVAALRAAPGLGHGAGPPNHLAMSDGR